MTSRASNTEQPTSRGSGTEERTRTLRRRQILRQALRISRHQRRRRLDHVPRAPVVHTKRHNAPRSFTRTPPPAVRTTGIALGARKPRNWRGRRTRVQVINLAAPSTCRACDPWTSAPCERRGCTLRKAVHKHSAQRTRGRRRGRMRAVLRSPGVLRRRVGDQLRVTQHTPAPNRGFPAALTPARRHPHAQRREQNRRGLRRSRAASRVCIDGGALGALGLRRFPGTC